MGEVFVPYRAENKKEKQVRYIYSIPYSGKIMNYIFTERKRIKEKRVHVHIIIEENS